MKQNRQNTLQNRKGFTLVELMIVVVIMGILVAVAIPIYNASTKNAKAKTCATNCDIIEKAATQYMMTYDVETVKNIFKDTTKTEVKVTTVADFKDNFTPEFLALFKEDNFPVCPEDGEITIKVLDGGTSIDASCAAHP